MDNRPLGFQHLNASGGVACQQKGTTDLLLKIFSGNEIYLVNESQAAIIVPAGTTVAGMGKGKFEVDSDKNANNIYLYELARP